MFHFSRNGYSKIPVYMRGNRARKRFDTSPCHVAKESAKRRSVKVIGAVFYFFLAADGQKVRFFH